MPVVSHSLRFVPMSTWRAICEVCWKLPGLWPGSMTTTLPSSGPPPAAGGGDPAGVVRDLPAPGVAEAGVSLHGDAEDADDPADREDPEDAAGPDAAGPVVRTDAVSEPPSGVPDA